MARTKNRARKAGLLPPTSTSLQKRKPQSLPFSKKNPAKLDPKQLFPGLVVWAGLSNQHWWPAIITGDVRPGIEKPETTVTDKSAGDTSIQPASDRRPQLFFDVKQKLAEPPALNGTTGEDGTPAEPSVSNIAQMDVPFKEEPLEEILNVNADGAPKLLTSGVKDESHFAIARPTKSNKGYTQAPAVPSELNARQQSTYAEDKRPGSTAKSPAVDAQSHPRLTMKEEPEIWKAPPPTNTTTEKAPSPTNTTTEKAPPPTSTTTEKAPLPTSTTTEKAPKPTNTTKEQAQAPTKPTIEQQAGLSPNKRKKPHDVVPVKFFNVPEEFDSGEQLVSVHNLAEYTAGMFLIRTTNGRHQTAVLTACKAANEHIKSHGPSAQRREVEGKDFMDRQFTRSLPELVELAQLRRRPIVISRRLRVVPKLQQAIMSDKAAGLVVWASYGMGSTMWPGVVLGPVEEESPFRAVRLFNVERTVVARKGLKLLEYTDNMLVIHLSLPDRFQAVRNACELANAHIVGKGNQVQKAAVVQEGFMHEVELIARRMVRDAGAVQDVEKGAQVDVNGEVSKKRFRDAATDAEKGVVSRSPAADGSVENGPVFKKRDLRIKNEHDLYQR